MFTNNLLLKNVILAGNSEGLKDILVLDGKINRVDKVGVINHTENTPHYDAKGLLCFPSFIDAHTHMREPGYEYKEDIQSGLTAAAYGGFSAIMCMANTKPCNDSASVTRFMLEQANKAFPQGPFLYPVGALTVGLKGEELAPLAELKEAGCIAFSNDGRPMENSDLFRHAVEYAADLNMLVIDHCEDLSLAKGGVMNEGISSGRLGLKGQPVVAESLHVARDILMAEYLNLPVHLAHISTAQSVELIRWAKKRGVKVTAETCPHYLLLDDTALSGYDANYKVSPPLRSINDVVALSFGLAEGVIDIMVTDHAPHAAHEKEKTLDEAPFGFTGLDLAVSLSFELVKKGIISLTRMVEIWSTAPASLFNLPVNRFEVGDPADFFLFDPDEKWVVGRDTLKSKSVNTPWLGEQITGRVKQHWLSGRPLIA
ncbi:dihydroorotase [Desulfovibrio litoralis]|uniref:Dihydroorotase n=1 Tax=Desulfovibrio litoralis DSM 11393 TaxID=1121455 RepID=A0A1M7SDG7_9BACT|nr:dihydroorotase [Desulfovibrio litoralis]SHN56567.1 dihydroorotase [Desulfovibrio litoralis DSM 11393]